MLYCGEHIGTGQDPQVGAPCSPAHASAAALLLGPS